MHKIDVSNFSTSPDSQNNIDRITILTWQLTLSFKEMLGIGSFCEVRKVIGDYTSRDVVLPYAIKIYDKMRLNSEKIGMKTGLDRTF
jgi:hypothetical protein